MWLVNDFHWIVIDVTKMKVIFIHNRIIRNILKQLRT